MLVVGLIGKGARVDDGCKGMGDAGKDIRGVRTGVLG